ncbi:MULTISPECIES: glycosyltransferase family 4 protein [Brevibacterium]|uniref:glycosyltransferase family 4 protein n=1 Tax=Brevibacterium TaxID=1696 RepID=UPI0015F0898C|nr:MULTISPECIES: glycosyltransferase family 4 protein [Brevibacterium]
MDISLGGTWDTGVDGERILRVPYLHSGSSMARQVLDQTVSAAGAISAACLRLRGTAAPDVVISTTPALPFLLAGDTVSRLLGVPHIAEVRDAWPDLISEMRLVSNAAGKRLPQALSSLLECSVLPGLLTRAQRRAAVVVVTTEGFRHRLQARGINAEVVRSGVTPAELAGVSGLTATGAIPVVPAPRTGQIPVVAPDREDRDEKAGTSHGLNLLYVGTVGRSQDLSTAIRAVRQTEGVRLRIVGDGVDKSALQHLAVELDIDVDFFPQQAGVDLAGHWEWADAGLVSLSNLDSYRFTVPSKLYSLMAREIPVVGVVAGEAAEIIATTDAGEVAAPGVVEAVVEAMHRMRDRLDRDQSSGAHAAIGCKPRDWVIEHASAQAMGRAYERILEQVCR